MRFHDGKKGVALAVRVVPRARKTEIAELMADGTLKIRLTAPPVAGKANKALIELLAEVLAVSPQQVEIVGGKSSRNKLVAVLDVSREAVERKLLDFLRT